MNSISIIGRLTANAELKTTSSGKNVTQFQLAVRRPFTSDKTDFIVCVAWEQKADYLCKYSEKGMQVAVTGYLTTRQYDDRNGQKRTAFECLCNSVEVLGKKQEKPAETTQQTFSDVTDDDDLPF